jgi:D-threo-aldose 1-dehydrogenase
LKIGSRNRIGGSEVHVTALGLGGAALGNLYAPVSESAALATVERALEAGVGYFDTAPYYGYGLSEQRLGRALAGVDRGAFVVSTKVGRLLVERAGEARTDQGFVAANRFDPVFDYGYDGVMRSFEASLDRLGLDRVDILLMHDVGAATHGEERHPEFFEVAMNEGYSAMRRLRDEGAVGAIGLGVNECAVCIDALGRVELDCLLLAGRYTLLEQPALDELLPLCSTLETSLIVGGPFNSGILAEADPATAHYDYAAAPPPVLERVRRLRSICDAHAVPLAAAALQYPLRHPAVVSVIPGARSAGEVEALATWLELDLPEALFGDMQDADLLPREAPIGVRP